MALGETPAASFCPTNLGLRDMLKLCLWMIEQAIGQRLERTEGITIAVSTILCAMITVSDDVLGQLLGRMHRSA